METPLVTREQDDYLAVKSFKDVKFVVWTETVKIWKIAFPVALSQLFQYLTSSSTSIYAGHLGDTELSSISISKGAISSIYLYLQLGMSTVLATLCGQAFGAGQIQFTCIYLQRSWIILVATCIILLPICIYATPILELLGQDKGIAKLGGKYAMLEIPVMFAFAIAVHTVRFLQAQGKVQVIMYIAFVGLVIQNGFLYIFTYVFHWGMTGLAMASNITGWSYALGLVVYAIGWCKESWTGFSWMAFEELWAFAKLSLAYSIMTCLEQWYLTCIMLLNGRLDNPVIAVGSYSICFNVQNWYNMVLFGISTAISVRVSNTLGMSHPRAAKFSFYVMMFQSLLLGIIGMIIIFLSKENLAVIFTNSEEMIHAVADLAYLLGISMVINSVSQVISGTICGIILQVLILIPIVWKTNWTNQVEQTAERMRIWSINKLNTDITETVA